MVVPRAGSRRFADGHGVLRLALGDSDTYTWSFRDALGSTIQRQRHSFATHLLEQGVDIRVIQHLLGHRHITSTTRYARVALSTISQVQSPLELLDLEGGPLPA